MKFKSRLVIILTIIMLMQSVLFGGTAWAAGGGTNLPNVTEYGLYNYVNSNTAEPTPVQVKYTGNNGVTYNAWPWEALTQIPCTLGGNQGIGIKFAVNVATDTQWNQNANNASKLAIYDATGNPIAADVIRLGDGSSNDVNRNYIFVVPKVTLQSGSSYKVVIDAGITANNGQQAGKIQQVNFTTAGEPAAPASVSLNLNRTHAVPGESVNVSGTAGTNRWVTIQALNSGQQVVLFDAVKSNASGNYQASFKVPAVAPGNLTILAGYGSNLASRSLGVIPEIAADTSIAADGSNKNLAVTANTPNAFITVPEGVSGATVNVGSLLTGNAAGGVSSSSLPALDIAAVTSINSNPVQVKIPAGTIVSGSASWTGSINVPTLQAANTVSVTPDSGKSATINTVIEIGYGDVPLTFSKAVRILIPGQAGKDVGYYRSGQFTKISNNLTADTQAAGDALADEGDGKINVGSDLVVWTKHFTKFVTYTQYSGGSGDSGSNNPLAPSWPSGSKLTGTKADQVVTLTWTAATDSVGVTGYKIYMEDTEIATVDGSTLTYKVQNVNGKHTFTVQAGNAAGHWTTNGPSSGEVGGGGNNPLNYISSNLTSISGNVSNGGGSVDGSSSVPVNPVIRIVFDRNVTGDAIWPGNEQCFTMQDSSGASVPITVSRILNTDNFDERQHIFVTPQSNLKAGMTYKIIISGSLKANNGRTMGNNASINFTVGGAAPITTAGPTITTGDGSVDPAVGATVGQGDFAKVVIPANALKGSSKVSVKVAKVDSPPAAPTDAKAASDVYEFKIGDSSSYSFASKVAITLSFDPAKVAAEQEAALFYYDESQSKWVKIDGGTIAGNSITVQLDHFTKFGVFAVKKTAVVPVVPVITKAKADLKDIEKHWAKAAIEKLLLLGAVSGYPDGTFKPDANISRAEFVTMLVKAFNLTGRSDKVFKDTQGHWAKEYIATASSLGIVSGYSDQLFGANDLITREQMAVMVVKAAKLATAAGDNNFADKTKISPWAKDAMATAIKNGIMKGYPDNTIRPQNKASRGEAVTLIASALK